MKREWGCLGVKGVPKDGGECRETLFLIAVMMSKSTHNSTEANKILLEIVHGLTKDQLCTPSAKVAFFIFSLFFWWEADGEGLALGSASFLCIFFF
jgi:hypothetical protein